MSNNDITQTLKQQTRPLSDDWVARREATVAARSLIEHLTTTTSDAAALRVVTVALREQTERMAEAEQVPGRVGLAAYGNGRFGNLVSIISETNPISGRSNALSPPLEIWFEDDTAHGRATLGWQYEGPPSIVHGGFVCALFDDFLGTAQTVTGQPGLTATITTNFHHPTPLNIELKLIGRIVEVSGRKNILSGEIWANDVMTASCKGMFINIGNERIKQLTESRSE